jgi:putative transposase
MVAAVRQGLKVRAVARRFHVSRPTVDRWVQRAKGKRLDRVDFSDHPGGCHHAANRTPERVEKRVLDIRRELREQSALGEFGAAAIYEELHARGEVIPSVRTIGRILARRGLLDRRCRRRYPPPPGGWYLTDVAQGRAELDTADLIEDLVIQGGIPVTVLNVTSLWGGLAESWPEAEISSKTAADRLIRHWRQFGLPGYAQFDNDTRFQGPHQFPDVIGRVIRLCLGLGVTPVFAPPREMGFQAVIENFNGRWQRAVWRRFHHRSLEELQQRSASFILALRKKNAPRMELAPSRRSFPAPRQSDPPVPLTGQILFIRRTTERGVVHFLGRDFAVDRHWVHRLVRCEVELDEDLIRFFSLRRREPHHQRLLREVTYHLPQRA